MKYELSKKAYQIDFSRIEEGFLYDSSYFVVHAENRNKAKSELIKKIYCENICLSGEDEEVTYLTIPVIRAKDLDLYLFEGNEMTIFRIEESLKTREENNRIEAFLKDDNITHCYIRKRGQYYAWNYSGYTDYKAYAGVYPKEEAVPYCKDETELTCVAINNTEHNEIILNQIARLKKGLIA